jgi:hypothetical protein
MSVSQIKKTGAAAGIIYPIMQMAAQGLIQVGGAEPSFTAPAALIVDFFQNRNPTLFEVGGYISVISFILFLWFVVFLWGEIRAVESENNLLSMVVLGSGLVATSIYLSSTGWELAMFRISEGLDPQLTRTLFDQGNLSFANSWVLLGSMVLVAGILFRQMALPGWLGWGSLILAVALILARFVWTSAIAFIPYAFFWLWMIALGVIYLRRYRKKGVE